MEPAENEEKVKIESPALQVEFEIILPCTESVEHSLTGEVKNASDPT